MTAQTQKENFMVCMEYLHSEALRVGLPAVAGIVQQALEDIRQLEGGPAEPLDTIRAETFQDDLVYAFHIFLAYMQTDSGSKRSELLSRLQGIETLLDHTAEVN
ncbi:MAG: hypothetical protein CL610_18945 [Anaerolineaceae bacterium]|nr:hypothetical protein [Anaerolineaceae bacterium]